MSTYKWQLSSPSIHLPRVQWMAGSACSVHVELSEQWRCQKYFAKFVESAHLILTLSFKTLLWMDGHLNKIWVHLKFGCQCNANGGQATWCQVDSPCLVRIFKQRGGTRLSRHLLQIMLEQPRNLVGTSTEQSSVNSDSRARGRPALPPTWS